MKTIQEITLENLEPEEFYKEVINNIGVYPTIEESLRNVNMFRYYKDSVCTMSDDEALDLYKGVIIYFGRQLGGVVVKNLFEDLYDWHRLDFAYKRVKHILLHEDEYTKKLVSQFIFGNNHWLAIQCYLDLYKTR